MGQPEITLYGANWCADCRRTKKYLGEQRIHYNWRDIEEESNRGQEANDFVLSANEKVSGKPKSKIPVLEFVGADGQTDLMIEPSNVELAKRLGLATTASKKFYEVIIIGGGPAGLTAALYLARDGYEVLVIEASTVGGQSFITNRLDNFPGFPKGITGEEFANNLEEQVKKFGVEILVPQRVVEIGPCHGKGTFDHCTFKRVITDSGEEFHCSAVLIATGSKYRELGVTGYEQLSGIAIHYCATCDAYAYKGKDIFVVGSGNSAFEEAYWLRSMVNHVTMIIRRDKASASPVLQEKVKDTNGIEILYNTEIKAVKGEHKLESVTLYHKDQDQIKDYYPDGIFVFIGLTPNTRFLTDVVELDTENFIIAPKFETSIKGIFAAGDSRRGSSKQAVTAAGEGAAAALLIREFLQAQ